MMTCTPEVRIIRTLRGRLVNTCTSEMGGHCGLARRIGEACTPEWARTINSAEEIETRMKDDRS